MRNIDSYMNNIKKALENERIYFLEQPINF